MEHQPETGGVYVSKEGWQPVNTGLDINGELVWELKMKEPWHMKMFPVRYKGDFSEQWMWLIACERGMEWDYQVYTAPEEDRFARKSRKLLARLRRVQ